MKKREKGKLELNKDDGRRYMADSYAHGGDIYGNDIDLDYSISVNPLGMPAEAKEAFAASLNHLEQYPDIHCRMLREKTATFESSKCAGMTCDTTADGFRDRNNICGVRYSEKPSLPDNMSILPEDIVFGNGAAELIYALCQALRPENVYLTAPGFGEYERAAGSAGAKLHFLKLRESERFHMPDIFTGTNSWQAPEPGSVIFLSNPLHPSGAFIDTDILLNIADYCERRNVWFCLDECFLDLCPDFTGRTMKPYLGTYSHLIILRAFTKVFAMPGLRLGYIISKSPFLRGRLLSALQPWNISVPAQEAGCAAVSDLSGTAEYLLKTREFIDTEKNYLCSRMITEGLVGKIYDSSANYIFFRAAPELYETLLSRRILIRSFRNDRGLDDRFCRICIRTHAENEELLRRWISAISN